MAVAGEDQPGRPGDAEEAGVRRQDDVGDDIAPGRQEDRPVLGRRFLQERLEQAALVVGKVGRQAARCAVDRAAKGRRFGRVGGHRGKCCDGNGTGKKAASIHVGSYGSHIIKDRAAGNVSERDGQRADWMSVWEKSSPLNSNGSPVSLARA